MHQIKEEECEDLVTENGSISFAKVYTKEEPHDYVHSDHEQEKSINEMLDVVFKEENIPLHLSTYGTKGEIENTVGEIKQETSEEYSYKEDADIKEEQNDHQFTAIFTKTQETSAQKNNNSLSKSIEILYTAGEDFISASAETPLIQQEYRDVEVKPFMCEICHKTFSRRRYLISHKVVHQNYHPFTCDTCNRQFSRKSNLERHSATCKKCKICKKSFHENEGLKIHIQTHNVKKLFTCDICDTAFPRKSNLARHRLIHTGIRPFMCSICNKSFLRKSNLARHNVKHTGTRSFECGLCNKSFFQKNDLAIHHRTHTGDRPFSCNFCGSSFSQRSTLIYHFRIHTGERPYTCNECNMSFIRKSQLARHNAIHIVPIIENS